MSVPPVFQRQNSLPLDTARKLGQGLVPTFPEPGKAAYNPNTNAVEIVSKWRNLQMPAGKIQLWFSSHGDSPPKLQANISCPFEKFESPREIKGGKDDMAKWMEIVAETVGFNGGMYDETAQHVDTMLAKEPKAMLRLKKKFQKGPDHAAAYLKADAAKGVEPNGRTDVVNKQVFKFYVIEDEEGNKQEFVQFLISANLFVESKKPLSDEEHEKNLAKFDPNSELFEFASKNRNMVPNEMFKFRSVATEEDVKWYTALRENSKYGSATFYGWLQVSFIKLYPYFVRDRMLLQLYLEKVHTICVVGSSGSSNEKAESIVSGEQRESMKRMFAVATGASLNEDSGGGGSASKKTKVEGTP